MVRFYRQGEGKRLSWIGRSLGWVFRKRLGLFDNFSPAGMFAKEAIPKGQGLTAEAGLFRCEAIHQIAAIGAGSTVLKVEFRVGRDRAGHNR